MEKKNIDWGNLTFSYTATDKRYVSMFKDGAWDEGKLIDDPNVVINESGAVLQYSQSCFEGLKAYETVDGHIVVFRPDLNAERMYNTAERLEMPPYPVDKFIDAVKQVVKANEAWVPPYGSGATLYLRPYMVAYNPLIGVKPAEEYMFRMFACPVGPYYKGGATSIKVKISDFDRAAPNGTGHVKAGLNYAMSLHASEIAHKEGFAENIFLDPTTRTKIEEAGGANAIFIDADGNLVVPKSKSILPSITRRSVVYVAEHYLGMKVDEREVYLDEVHNFVEMGLCGTAAVISPVESINDHGKEIVFKNNIGTMGPKLKKIYDTLTGIQMGSVEAPEGWVVRID